MADIPTVKIKVTPSEGNEAGIVIINESDFDPEQHERADEEEQKEHKKHKKKADGKDEKGADGKKSEK